MTEQEIDIVDKLRNSNRHIHWKNDLVRLHAADEITQLRKALVEARDVIKTLRHSQLTDKLLTWGELADATGLSPAWIKREAEAGRIPYLQVGARRMFDRNRVREVLDQRAAKIIEGQRGVGA